MNNLSILRAKSGLSQKELAEILGVAQNTVSNWELGKRQISAEKLISIASLFKISVDDIIFTEDSKKKEANNSPFNKTSGIEEILYCYEKLNDKGKAKANEIMQDLVEIPRYTKDSATIYRAARSNFKNSFPQKTLSKDTIEKLKKAKEIKNEKSLK